MDPAFYIPEPELRAADMKAAAEEDDPNIIGAYT
jgi:hypothetical protein